MPADGKPASSVATVELPPVIRSAFFITQTSRPGSRRELWNTRIISYLDDNAFRNIALGENYFRLLGLDENAPEVCSRP